MRVWGLSITAGGEYNSTPKARLALEEGYRIAEKSKLTADDRFQTRLNATRGTKIPISQPRDQIQLNERRKFHANDDPTL